MVQLGRLPDTNCIQDLGSRHCGPCTWSSSLSGTAERWGGRGVSSDLEPVPSCPCTLITLTCSAPWTPLYPLCPQPQGPPLLPPLGPGNQPSSPRDLGPPSPSPRDPPHLSPSSLGTMLSPPQPPSPYHPRAHVRGRRLEHKGRHLVGHQVPTGPATVPPSHQQDAAT